MDKEFFESVVSLPTVSGHEDRVVDFIETWAGSNGCRFRQDGRGNVYLVKGGAEFFPCVVGHMDTVHKDQLDLVETNTPKTLKWEGDVVKAEHPATGKQTGLGADDLCGIAVSLAAMSKLPACKAVFTVEEERGCVGAKAVDKSFFDDVAFVIGTDSPESNRATRHSDGTTLCGDDFFETYLKPVCAKHGVTTFNSEPMCDCKVYREIDVGGKRIECFNFGSGGYDPHQSSEYAKFSEVQNAEELLVDLCRSIPADRQWTSEPKTIDVSTGWWKRFERPATSVYDRYRSLFGNVEPDPEFDAKPGDMKFTWTFRAGLFAARTYANRVPKMLQPDATVEYDPDESPYSVTVIGRKEKLRDAFRFAYNYDNDGKYRTWDELVTDIPQAEEEFERCLEKADPPAKPVDQPSDDEFCSIDLPFDDPDKVMEFMNDVAAEEIPVDVDDQIVSVNLYGRLENVKAAYVLYWNMVEGSKYRSWTEFEKAEKLYAAAFFDDVVFDAGRTKRSGRWDDDVIDADFTMKEDEDLDEQEEWLREYESRRIPR